MEALARPHESLSRRAEAAILPSFLGVLAYAAVSQGGFYRPQAMLVVAALGALSLASLQSMRDLVPHAVGVAVLGAGIATSAIATEVGAYAWLTLAALAVAAAAVPVARMLIARGERAALLEGISWIGAGIAVAGVVGIALHKAPWALRAQGLWRNSSTLTYANAAGELFLLAIGASILLLKENATAWRRLAAFAILCGLATTLSRGAAVAAIAAAITLVATRNARLIGVLARPALGALIAAASMVPSMASAHAKPVPAIAGLIAGAAIAAGGRRMVLAAGIAALVSAALLVSSPALGRVLDKRAVPGSETRLRTWRNTWTIAIRHPVTGTGPGTFSIVEEDPRDGLVLTRFAHNDYLQAFSETGAVGIGSIAIAGGIFARWAWRLRRKDNAWAVGVAMCVAFAVHSAVDFVWQMPLLVALAFVWLAVAVTPPLENGGPT